MRVMVLSDDANFGGKIEKAINGVRLPVVVTIVSRLKDGPKAVLAQLPDLLLVNWEGWGGRGQDMVQSIRRISFVPLVAVSTRDDEEEAARALDSGADAYVPLCQESPLLAARAQALLRRASGGSVVGESDIELGELVVQPETRTVKVRDAQIKLTPSEYRLLRCLTRYPGRLVPTETLQSLVWPTGQPATGGQLKVFVSRLRSKLGADLGDQLIVTERGRGYRLAVPAKNTDD